MSPHPRSPNQPGVRYPPQRGVGDPPQRGNEMPGGPVALGKAGGGVAGGDAATGGVAGGGLAGGGVAGRGLAAGPPGNGLLAGGERTSGTGGIPPGLVQRVQRRLAAAGVVATDTAGLRTAVTEVLSEDGVLLASANLTPIVRAIGDELTGLARSPRCSPIPPSLTSWSTAPPTSGWSGPAPSSERPCGSPRRRPLPPWCNGWSPPSGCAWTSRVPGSTLASPAASGSTRCCHRSLPTARWSPSEPSPGAGSSSAT